MDSLLDHDFGSCFDDTDIDSTWICIKEAIFTFIAKFVPRSKMSASPCSVPWLRGPLRHHLNKICTLRRRYAKSPSSSLWVKLTDSELAFSNAFHEAKLKYEEDLVSDHGPNHTKL